MGGYSKENAAKDTNTSTSKVSEAWHDARDDAAKDGKWGIPSDRHGDKGDKSDKSDKCGKK
ncbi:MAG: hypothetical protein L6Q29_04325 [Candidatus Pacebacteria bacterium]|nr:hypothetical protein [Candidatus Paceibacterota bacterium]